MNLSAKQSEMRGRASRNFAKRLPYPTLLEKANYFEGEAAELEGEFPELAQLLLRATARLREVATVRQLIEGKR